MDGTREQEEKLNINDNKLFFVFFFLKKKKKI